MSRKARSVVDVILGEAGGGTPQERLTEMLGIASVIANRAQALGISMEDVIAQGNGTQFNAYNKALPEDIERFAPLAQQALDYVTQNGPVTSATFFSASGTKAPTGASQVAQVGPATTFYEGTLGAPQTAQAAPASTGAWSTTPGSNVEGVDHRLTDVLSTAAAQFAVEHPGYSVQGFSGKKGRATGTPNHPAGRAIDVNIIGPDGHTLGNVRNGNTFGIYQDFANTAKSVQHANYPELDSKFAWGGYFKQGTAFDQMHFDLGGLRGAYGSWETGLNDAGKAAMASLGFPDVQTAGWSGSPITVAALPDVVKPEITAPASISPQIAAGGASISASPSLASMLNPISSAQAGEMGFADRVAPSLADRLAPLQAERVAPVQTASLDPLSGYEHVIGRDVTPPDAAMPGQNRMMPDLTARMADNPPSANDITPTVVADYYNSQPQHLSPLTPEHLTPLATPDVLSAIKPTERVSPLTGYDVQSPIQPTETLTPEKRIRNQPIPPNETLSPLPASETVIGVEPTAQPPQLISPISPVPINDETTKSVISPVPAKKPAAQPDVYPAVPEQPSLWDKAMAKAPIAQDALRGFQIAGIPGALAGGFLGAMPSLGLNFSDGPNGFVPAKDRFSVGFGLPGITSAMGGPYGATGYSSSLPGAFVTSRGMPGYFDLTNPFGAITTYANDHIVGNSNLLGRIAGMLGIGGRKDISPRASDAIDKGGSKGPKGLY